MLGLESFQIPLRFIYDQTSSENSHLTCNVRFIFSFWEDIQWPIYNFSLVDKLVDVPIYALFLISVIYSINSNLHFYFFLNNWNACAQMPVRFVLFYFSRVVYILFNSYPSSFDNLSLLLFVLFLCLFLH